MSRVTRRTFLLAASAALAAPVVLPAARVRAGGGDDVLDQLVREAMAAAGVPGVVVAWRRGQEQVVRTWGLANAETGIPVRRETAFQIGSVTKTMTGLALLRLEAMGLLSLDQPVRDLIPGLRLSDPAATASVTVRQLLNHTSGLVTNSWLPQDRSDAALARWTEEVVPTLPLVLPPGEWVSYSNAGISLAGRVIETVTGKRYEDAMAELVFRPLGMDGVFFGASDVPAPGATRGHAVLGGRVRVLTPYLLPRNSNPAGGLLATADDLLAYSRVWTGNGRAGGTELVPGPAIQQAMQPQSRQPFGLITIGIAWGIGSGPVRFVSHDGGTIGFVSRLAIYPDRDTVLVVLTNGEGGSAVLAAVQDWFNRTVLGASPASPRAPGPWDGDLDRYVGVYENPGESRHVLRREGDLLLVTPIPTDAFLLTVGPDAVVDPQLPGPAGDPDFEPLRLRVDTQGLAVGADAPGFRAGFLLGDGGAVRGYFSGGRLYRRAG